MEATKASSSSSSSSSSSVIACAAKLKKASLLWLEGFREACCLHRVFLLCLRSRKLLIRTGQCFLLNGLIFLGSLVLNNSALLAVFYNFIPSYVFISYSSFMYSDIAECGFAAAERSAAPTTADPLKQKETLTLRYPGRVGRPAGLGGVMIGIGEQVYSILLLTVFFIEIFATGFVPYLGKALNFLLLSWIYAYYCFEYKWNQSAIDLDKRLNFFESNWAFFAGFGSPCVLPVLFFSPLVTYGIMAILFPLFVLTATDSEAETVLSSQRKKWGDAELGRLPIFYAADTLSLRILSLFPLEPQQQLKDGNKAQ
ncbi:hypothetical protein TIFTF001_001409 [Ficus carica]|uniref:Uncharacterized protein n=1 Tax=Ficus carica TaxID=3494 RepID=A0AA87YYR5_FICCA|nr:hypothetical protein TIFTF001_001409 [Ficus carica]